MFYISRKFRTLITLIFHISGKFLILFSLLFYIFGKFRTSFTLLFYISGKLLKLFLLFLYISGKFRTSFILLFYISGKLLKLFLLLFISPVSSEYNFNYCIVSSELPLINNQNRIEKYWMIYTHNKIRNLCKQRCTTVWQSRE